MCGLKWFVCNWLSLCGKHNIILSFFNEIVKTGMETLEWSLETVFSVRLQKVLAPNLSGIKWFVCNWLSFCGKHNIISRFFNECKNRYWNIIHCVKIVNLKHLKIGYDSFLNLLEIYYFVNVFNRINEK